MRFRIAIFAVVLATAVGPGTLRAQGAIQSITGSRETVVQLTTGYRASRVIGSTVYSNTRDAVGKIDDLIVDPRDNVTYAVMSVGGFLGLGTHLVAVPFGTMHIVNRQLVLQDATRDSLRALPEFRYPAP